jgi:hypothetical protein
LQKALAFLPRSSGLLVVAFLDPRVILNVTEGGVRDPLYLSFDIGAKRRSADFHSAAVLSRRHERTQIGLHFAGKI